MVSGGTCSSDPDGFGDIAEGAQVEIRDETGEIIGLGRLQEGKQDLGERELTWQDWVVYDPAICKFRFEVETQAGADFYSLSIGNGQRGALSYTEEELRIGVDLSLGN